MNESLPNGLHNLTIRIGQIGDLFSLILLDKIMYRYVVSTLGSTGSPKSRVFADRNRIEVRMMARLHQASSGLYRPQALSLRSLRILPSPSATHLSLAELLADSHASSLLEDSSSLSVAEDNRHTIERLATCRWTKAHIHALVPPHD